MLGLARHTVRLSEPDPQWPALFRAERDLLRACTGELLGGIEHVGSTAVPGLCAKPILDIAALLPAAGDLPAVIAALAPRQYLYRGAGEGGELLVRDLTPDVRSVHLHLLAPGDPRWDDYLGFRDLLCVDAALRERYAALKRELASRFASDRTSYTAGKHDFIREVLRTRVCPA